MLTLQRDDSVHAYVNTENFYIDVTANLIIDKDNPFAKHYNFIEKYSLNDIMLKL